MVAFFFFNWVTQLLNTFAKHLGKVNDVLLLQVLKPYTKTLIMFLIQFCYLQASHLVFLTACKNGSPTIQKSLYKINKHNVESLKDPCFILSTLSSTIERHLHMINRDRVLILLKIGPCGPELIWHTLS